MNKLEYFIESIKAGRYIQRAWLYRCFSVGFKNKTPTDVLPGYDQERGWFVGVDEPVDIIDAKPKESLFPIKERFTLEKGTFPGITETVETNYGEVILYVLIFLFSCKGKIPFKPGSINKKYLSKTVAHALSENLITANEYFDIVKGLNQSTLFSDLHVTTYTPKSLNPSPEVLALRNELLEKYKDQLNDPAVVAIIDEAIAEADREYMKGDPSEKFYLKDKAYAVVRKKLYYLQGGVESLDRPGEMDYLAGSLDEGYKAEDLPVIINQLRAGSYDRGVSTALGGEAAKFSNRVFQNLKIAEEDCGTSVGKPELVDGTWDFTGRYIVGRDEPISEADMKSLMGKTIYLRDPTACATVNGNYCYKCMGEGQRRSKLGLGPRMAEICSVFLSVSLAAFHGRSSKTTVLVPERDWK